MQILSYRERLKAKYKLHHSVQVIKTVKASKLQKYRLDTCVQIDHTHETGFIKLLCEELRCFSTSYQLRGTDPIRQLRNQFERYSLFLTAQNIITRKLRYLRRRNGNIQFNQPLFAKDLKATTKFKSIKLQYIAYQSIKVNNNTKVSFDQSQSRNRYYSPLILNLA
ncbi:Hypothetical_protein [Hexamita inflata]|uniref:Hypothetical_protein n=1 Tax=Hexamita inflata TaxID=28002 RepID=A0AA86Q189_9EUKA|nr:Hypothetical protein HINF_LOCUS35363 [Hexamita inflata]